MRKQTIHFAGVVLLAAAASAQAQNNTSVVSQTGTMQSSTVVQTGNANQSTVEQLTGSASSPNTGNVARTSQIAGAATVGDVNQVFIRQLDGSDYNEATISQRVGSNNRAYIEQKGNASFRSGGTQLRGSETVPSSANAGNYAIISQAGTGNGAGTLDRTEIRQNAGPLGTSQANYARIQQVGDNNLNTIIDQNNLSVGNTASIDQGVSNSAATGNTAVVLQIDNSQLNQAAVVQEGAAKVAEVFQTEVSNNNQVSVTQLGVDGFASVFQSDNSLYNQATVVQTDAAGSGNSGTVFQTNQSSYNRATIEQAGSSGAALINQTEQSRNNDARILQGVGGNGNSAVITQTYAYDGAGSSLSYGSGNSATISQNQTTNSTVGNSADIQQGFSGGISTISGMLVISDNNAASISQENDVNAASLLQGGIGNTATATQNGFSTLQGTDPLLPNPALQIGNSNVMTVNQTGSAANPNVANISQIGNGNTATVGQTVPTP